MLLLMSAAAAQDDFKPVFKPSLQISRAPGDIKIDGQLNDAGWKNAPVAANFAENEPGDNVRPPVETRAMLTYDDDNLYVAIVCYDDPAKIRASWCERDRMYNDDNVGFFFDTYGDASWAYTLNINPHGIQADAIWSSGYGEDSKYDLIWESAGQITDSGYQVEAAIPFSSLRFPDKERQTWRIEFWRHHYRDSHHNISWSAYDRDEPCWPCQWGTLTGIENVKPGRGIEFIPAFIGYQSGEMVVGDYHVDSTRPVSFDNKDINGEMSLNGKYAISSNITVEAAYNPDFSQVEADADQIDVNSITALSFPEKRPFFQEGSDLFNTLFNVVYTRSINDPEFAVKMTARLNRTSISYLGAYDESSPVVLPFEEGSSPVFQAGKSTNNLFRARQTFGENSQVGLLMTDRRYEGGGTGSTYGVDGAFRLSKNFKFRWQSTASYTSEPDDTTITQREPGDTLYTTYHFDGKHTAAFDGESYWGRALIGLLDYEARDVYVSGRYSEMDETFRVDNGDERRNNRRQASVMAVYNYRFEQGLVERLSPDVFAARIWNMDGQIKDEWVQLSLAVPLRKAQIEFHANGMYSRENYHGIQFDHIWQTHLCGHSLPSHQVALGGSVNYGHRIARHDEVMGREISLGAWIDVRPINRMFLENTFSFLQSRHIDSSRVLYKGFIARSRMELQFTKELSLRFLAQYNDFYETWDFDPLLTYRISPFSLLYIGTTYDYERIYGLTEPRTGLVKEGDVGYEATRLKARQFFMKLQYLFQL